jgi:hypothetical protein
LNGDYNVLPEGLRTAIDGGKEILFLINPPYQDGSELSTDEGESGLKNNVQTKMNKEMLENGWGKCSKQLFAQFLYRITKFQETNKNVKIALICKPLYFTGESYKDFRKFFFNEFGYENGFLFEASHFSDVAKGWGISCSLFSNRPNQKRYIHDLIDYSDDFTLKVFDTKEFYNTDKLNSLSKWMGKDDGVKKEGVRLSSYVSVANDGKKRNMLDNSFGMVVYQGNAVMKNQKTLTLMSSAFSHLGTFGRSVSSDNFLKVTSFFTSRKSITNNWINDKDEYLAPNEQHEEYQQFVYDSIVYSLFNNSSQQSSLRNVNYNNQEWNINNEFFWLSKEQMIELANDNGYDELYRDARNGSNRYVYVKLFGEGVYDLLSDDAKGVLDMATELVKKSISMRQAMSDTNPEYHLNSWDSGYAQLKLVWKEYFKDDFDAFRKAYTRLEERMRPLVYELGFLKK